MKNDDFVWKSLFKKNVNFIQLLNFGFFQY